MKVLFIPSSKDNPYQKLLTAALTEKGVEVDSNIGFSSSSFNVLCRLIYGIIRKRKPDIIHVHWLVPFVKYKSRFPVIFDGIIFLATMTLSRFMDIKIIWTVHNLTSHDFNNQKIEYLITYSFIKLCNAIIVHSNTAKFKFMDYFNCSVDRIKIIPHGNFISYYKNNVSRDEACRFLKLDPTKKIFLFFGKMRPYKGVESLIKSFRGISDGNSLLLIAGKPVNDKQKKQLTNLSSKSNNILLFLKYIPDDEIQYYMNAADVVVLPYIKIFTSGTLLLAMSYSKSIIAPNLGLIPDILDDKGGILYEKGDLEKALSNILNINLEKCGEYNYKKIKNLDWNNIADKTNEVYMDCLQNCKKSK